MVYSLYSRGILVDLVDYMDKGEFRVDSICKMKTFSHMDSIKDKISIECSDKAMNISDQLSVTRSIVSTEVARVHANLELDLVLQEMNLYIILMYGY